MHGDREGEVQIWRSRNCTQRRRGLPRGEHVVMLTEDPLRDLPSVPAPEEMRQLVSPLGRNYQQYLTGCPRERPRAPLHGRPYGTHTTDHTGCAGCALVSPQVSYLWHRLCKG